MYSTAELRETPDLDFIAWEEEWERNKSAVIRHPDGSLVTDSHELALLNRLPYPMFGRPAKSGMKNIFIWVSHPLIEEIERDEFSQILADGSMKSLDYDSSRQVSSADLGTKTWATYQIEVVDQPSIKLRMSYVLGPMRDVQNFPVERGGSRPWSLPPANAIAVVGQNVDGDSFVNIRVDQSLTRNQRYDVEAVLKNGKILSSAPWRSMRFDQVGNEEFPFPVPLTEIVKFRIGTKGIRTVTWTFSASLSKASVLEAVVKPTDGLPESIEPDSATKKVREIQHEPEEVAAVDVVDRVKVANDYLDLMIGIMTAKASGAGPAHTTLVVSEKALARFMKRYPEQPDETTLKVAKERLLDFQEDMVRAKDSGIGSVHPMVVEVQAKIDGLSKLINEWQKATKVRSSEIKEEIPVQDLPDENHLQLRMVTPDDEEAKLYPFVSWEGASQELRLADEVIASDRDVVGIHMEDSNGDPALILEFNDEGAARLRAATAAANGRMRLAILVNGVVRSAPVVMVQLGKNVQISGMMNAKERESLFTMLPQNFVEASEIALHWLDDIDVGKYRQTFESASELVKASLDVGTWETLMASQRGPFGTVISRSESARMETKELPGMPSGDYRIIDYQTKFAEKADAAERVTLMKEKDGVWRVAGYFIK